MAEAEEIRLVRVVEEQLAEAEGLVAKHPEMAVVRAVSAFELFLRRAFLEPYLRHGVLAENPELANVVIRSLLGDAIGWREKLAPLMWSCWRIDLKSMPSWRELGRAWSARNAILHDGTPCSSEEARSHLTTCRIVIEALLLARFSAGSETDAVAADHSETTSPRWPPRSPTA